MQQRPHQVWVLRVARGRQRVDVLLNGDGGGAVPVFVIAGNAYSTTPPPPVSAMNTYSPERTASCVKCVAISTSSTSAFVRKSILSSASRVSLGRQLCGRETTQTASPDASAGNTP